jgi:hypothetical protein
MIRHCLRIAAFAAALGPLAGLAEDRSFVLSAPPVFEDSGLAKYLLPRFALKTGTRVTLGAPGDLALLADAEGRPVFQQGDTVYRIGPAGTPAAQSFVDWLTSEIGLATIDSFVPADGQPGFSRPTATARTDAGPVYEGDAAHGERVSLQHCGRCHVISEKNRWNGIGSTPSFGVLRAQSDWGSRFEAFYVLAPHPAFTQIDGLTEPFDITRPSPIVPIEMTPADLDAILAFVSAIEPAELGAPIHHQ